MSHHVSPDVGHLGAFRMILSDTRGETLKLTLRAPDGEMLEVQGVNAGDRVVDGEGREYCYRDYPVEEIH